MNTLREIFKPWQLVLLVIGLMPGALFFMLACYEAAPEVHHKLVNLLV